MSEKELFEKYRVKIGLLILIIGLVMSPYLFVFALILLFPNLIIVFIGGLVGAFIGLLLHPPVALSYNYMLVGAIIGAFIGWVTSEILRKAEYNGRSETK